MYSRSGTVDKSVSEKLQDIVAYTPSGRFVCAHKMAALFCVKYDVVTAVLELRRHIRIQKSESDSVNLYVFT